MGTSYGAPLGGGQSPSSGASSSSGAADAAHQTSVRRARKTRVGTVVSDKMQKTVVVAIERRVAHPTYGKMITRTTHLKAHDEQNASKTGDTVRIVETRPLSKDKRWRVVEILERAR
jgi:small subunit ribosomal protein S17